MKIQSIAKFSTFVFLLGMICVFEARTANAESCTDTCQVASEEGLRASTDANSPECCCKIENGLWLDKPVAECEAPFIPTATPTPLEDS